VENNILTMPPVKDTPFTKGGSLSVKKSKSLRSSPGANLQTSFTPLSAFQLQSVALFIHVFGALSLPRSIGEIYGLLFSTPEPLSLDDVQTRLQLSRGSASEGLRWLRSLGAVNQVYLPGIRKEHFTAETSLRKLASGYLRDRIDPHLENGPNRLSALESSIDPASASAHFEKSRLGQIAGWYKFFGKVLPLVKALAGKF
jgi:DNA-binding transcriptional regulator GbsR (MarR family)